VVQIIIIIIITYIPPFNIISAKINCTKSLYEFYNLKISKQGLYNIISATKLLKAEYRLSSK